METAPSGISKYYCTYSHTQSIATIVDGNHQSVADHPRLGVILHVEALDKVKHHLHEWVALGGEERGHNVRQSLDGALHLWDKDQLLQTLSTSVVGLQGEGKEGCKFVQISILYSIFWLKRTLSAIEHLSCVLVVCGMCSCMVGAMMCGVCDYVWLCYACLWFKEFLYLYKTMSVYRTCI